jgi:hypothetical protein
MECLIGIKGKDFILMASDSVVARSVVSMKQGEFVVRCKSFTPAWNKDTQQNRFSVACGLYKRKFDACFG